MKRRWYDIGLQLGVCEDRLEEIQAEHRDDLTKCLRYVLRNWRKQIAPCASWAGLVRALRECTVGEADLAANLEEKYVFDAPDSTADSTDEGIHSPPVPRQPPQNLFSMRPEEVPDPQVQRELEHLYELFENLVIDIYTYLEENKPDLKEFAVFASSQPPSWRIKRPRPMADVDFGRMIATDTEFYQMFSIISRYVSWHNYELLEKVARRYGSSDLREQMQKYREELEDFEKHTSAEVLQNVIFAGAQPDSVAILAILPHHQPNQLTMNNVTTLKHGIEEKSGLARGAVRTHRIKKSSVEIIFLVPIALAPYVIVSCSCTFSSLFTTEAPLSGDIYERAVYTMYTEEVFRLMGKTVPLPATQKSDSTSNLQQVSLSGSPVYRHRESNASELSEYTPENVPEIDPSLVQVHNHKTIMRGDNSVIVKASYLSLPCAAKYIHPKLTESSTWQVEAFEKGCRLMRNLHHPNIVTHLGVHRDHSVVGPILLLELMALSLKEFLEKKQNASLLPLHTQLDLCSDVAHGLEYLHAKDIIHGNLTATNVLVKEGRAKICGTTSLQLNKLDGELSLGSGAAVSLPRRSFRSAIYDEHVDCFSFGVLAMHIITRQMPRPLTKVLEPDNGCISETLRYAASLKQVDCKHPMHQLIVECLHDVPFQRPAATKLCKELSEMKKSSNYKNSKTSDLLAKSLVYLHNQSLKEKVHEKAEENKTLNEQLEGAQGELKQREEEVQKAEEERSKAKVDWENMQNTITRLRLQNEDLEEKVAAASKEADDKKTALSKSADANEAMLAKIRDYKDKFEESDRNYARLLSEQDQ